MELKVYKCNDRAIIPHYATSDSAGLDLHSVETATLAPGENHLFHTGLIMEIPSGYFGAVYPRSGLSIKQGLRLSNCVGVIDADYRGEVMVSIYNDSATNKTIECNDRIAQMIIQPYVKVSQIECSISDLSKDTERGTGGFGSTGK